VANEASEADVAPASKASEADVAPASSEGKGQEAFMPNGVFPNN